MLNRGCACALKTLQILSAHKTTPMVMKCSQIHQAFLWNAIENAFFLPTNRSYGTNKKLCPVRTHGW
jgi:hypothetical protein